MGRPSWKPSAITTDESATVEPTEMSNSPRMMMNTMGRTMKALSRKEVRASRRLSKFR